MLYVYLLLHTCAYDAYTLQLTYFLSALYNLYFLLYFNATHPIHYNVYSAPHAPVGIISVSISFVNASVLGVRPAAAAAATTMLAVAWAQKYKE